MSSWLSSCTQTTSILVFYVGVLLSIRLFATHCFIKIIKSISYFTILCFQAFLVDLRFFCFCWILEGYSYPVLMIYPSMNKAMKILCLGLVSTSLILQHRIYRVLKPRVHFSSKKQFLQLLIWRSATIKPTDVFLYFYISKMQFVRWKQLGQQPELHQFSVGHLFVLWRW